jgi:hypothetical protein
MSIVEDLITNIICNFIASGFWKAIDFFVNKRPRNEISSTTNDISKAEEKTQYNIYHGNTPLTYIGNGKFGDHY